MDAETAAASDMFVTTWRMEERKERGIQEALQEQREAMPLAGRTAAWLLQDSSVPGS